MGYDLSRCNRIEAQRRYEETKTHGEKQSIKKWKAESGYYCQPLSAEEIKDVFRR